MSTFIVNFSFISNKFFLTLGGISHLLSEFVIVLFKAKIDKKILKDQIYQVGVRSFNLILVTAVCAGLVMALQFGLGLEKFGGKLYVPKIVSLSFIRELGPVFTALVMAGRVGAGFASEIGSMVVTQQVDALRALGTSPMVKIVVPRVLALIISLPLLTVFAIVIGIWASLILGKIELNLDGSFYYSKVIETIVLKDLSLAVIKSIVFAVVIAIPACYFGLNVKTGTKGVGVATTKAVVVGTVLIFITNFLITKVFFTVLL